METKASVPVLVLGGYLCALIRQDPPSSATSSSHHLTSIDVAKIGYAFPLWQYIDSLKVCCKRLVASSASPPLLFPLETRLLLIIYVKQACKRAADFKSAVMSRRKAIDGFEAADQPTLEVAAHDIVW